MPKKATVGFEISISGRDDGTIEACYILISDKRASRTAEVIEDVLLADYDRQGNLVGIEVLAPVPLSTVVKLVEQKRRSPLRRFLEAQAPEELIAC